MTDAQKLREIAENLNGEMRCEYFMQQDIRRIADRLEKEEWISVDDRLPAPPSEDDPLTFPVLIYFSGEYGIASYNHTMKEWVDSESWIIKFVTHWQPLPQPPKTK